MDNTSVRNQIKSKRSLTVRIAENQYEIEKALTLRYNVFNLEMQEGLPQSHSTGKDRDEYDRVCDHLIVLDKNTDEVVGTYRILQKSVAESSFGFYSENEFDMKSIVQLNCNFAEVGRSCVHPEYRDGSVISLLWAGLGSFMQEKEIRYLMGCGSLHTTDPLIANRAYAFLKGKSALAGEEFRVYPKEDFLLPGFREDLEFDSVNELTRFVPPLIKGYVRVGAKVCGFPALDREFKTIDFFLLFDREEIDARYGSHYLKQ
ncbi:MAG: GNAT family N-acetyltransferase [Leptospiraceae bacterium]|nr:GNAT family N-acetyltransferase [Leptospiraceae bacterium]